MRCGVELVAVHPVALPPAARQRAAVVDALLVLAPPTVVLELLVAEPAATRNTHHQCSPSLWRHGRNTQHAPSVFTLTVATRPPQATRTIGVHPHCGDTADTRNTHHQCSPSLWRHGRHTQHAPSVFTLTVATRPTQTSPKTLETINDEYWLVVDSYLHGTGFSPV